MPDIYDVAIIGLGPAGATLARLLDAGLSVLAIDRGDTAGDGGFHKPCGGLLAPDAQKILARLNLTLPVDLLVDPQIFSVRTIDVAANLVRHYQRFYLNLDRHKFDLWLRSLIPERVELHGGSVLESVRRTEPGYQITWRKAGQAYTACARYLVGADGAASRVRSLLFPQVKTRRYLSIQQWFEDCHPTPFYSCIFDADTTDCYAWGLTKQRYFLFGGAFNPQGGRERFEALKDKLRPHGFRLEHPVCTEACLVLRPSGPASFCCGGQGAFLVGEAAGFISPSSLEGISYALGSAVALSEVLNSRCTSPNACYRRRTLPIRLRLISKRLKSPAMYQPLLRRLVMKSGLASIRVKPLD